MQVEKYKNNFCSKECETIYKYKQTHEIRVCDICGNNFDTLKKSTQRFCSMKCQSKWQKTLVGKSSKSFKSIKIKCDWCNSYFYVVPYKLRIKQKHFCSIDCRREWYSKILSQTKEWKNKHRKKAVMMLESGRFNHTETACQKKANIILEKENISYENEKGFEFFAVDNFLTDFNLIIEVMGTFWHCDRRIYSSVEYNIQKNRIDNDKRKKAYKYNKHMIRILYLWEYDLFYNFDLCKKLVNLYIKKQGEILFNHSSDYMLDANNNLVVRELKVKQYMELNKDEVVKYINIKTKNIISRKQMNKWNTLVCNKCGNKFERLISKTNNTFNYCSRKCSSNSRILIK